jgi:hypothetical protein
MLLPLLAAAFLALAAPPSHAAPAGDSRYITLQVPDLPRAARFFQAVMNCAPVDAGADATQSALLDCGNGSIVSLTRAAAPDNIVPRVPSAAIVADDAVAAAAWLRANHVRIVGQPALVVEGPGMREVVVTFLTPWGQPLRLVSHAAGGPAQAMPVDARLAAQ